MRPRGRVRERKAQIVEPVGSFGLVQEVPAVDRVLPCEALGDRREDAREEIGQALADAAGLERYDFARDHAEIAYKRFRSDAERKGRQYRVLRGRERDEVREWLFYVHKPRLARSGPARRAS